ncbi:hypothetical protein EV182_005232 [Spiromyces aspiralis]|uniref:Uncharacterized protein n=1 Tax=Spiromyces aspiralis TaxID=68401 RepID=A0ACC1HR99_9FUNG|nr:hypothetical protein EV182_005232 [Spiromyces aspiralis]
MHKSLVGNNYHYQACYFEYGGTGTQLYQALYKYMSASVDSVLTYLHWPLRWPSFPETSPSGSLTGGGNGNGTTVIQPSDNDDSNGGVSKATKSTIPLILFISQASINSDCSSQHITNDQDCKNWQALAWFRFRQQQMYYQTLTNNVLLLMCTGTTSTDPIPCAPGFVWRRPDWLSIQLINGFGGNVSDGDSSETTSSSNGSDMSSPTSTTSTVTKTQTATSVESWLETVTTTITQVTEGETHTITETHLTTRTLGDIKTSTLNTWQ